MAYKNPEDQAAAGKRHYEKNRDKIINRSSERNKVQRIRNREFVNSIKQISECVDCGESNPVVLDFDHVRGKKILAISNMAHSAYGIEAIENEMMKCDVRCANCHRIVTHNRKNDKRAALRKTN